MQDTGALRHLQSQIELALLLIERIGGQLQRSAPDDLPGLAADK